MIALFVCLWEQGQAKLTAASHDEVSANETLFHKDQNSDFCARLTCAPSPDPRRLTRCLPRFAQPSAQASQGDIIKQRRRHPQKLRRSYRGRTLPTQRCRREVLRHAGGNEAANQVIDSAWQSGGFREGFPALTVSYSEPLCGPAYTSDPNMNRVFRHVRGMKLRTR
mmetsp:Transcript_82297/g.266426  ORF Transcript_82297/g.266426 Transcript_82297/m.266426 type:complete len:167 (+) Transcript_82297:97-597(+)